MTQVLLVGGICVALYGVFLTIRGLVNVYRDQEMKMFWSVLALFVGAPLLLLAILFLVKSYNLWTVLPVLMTLVSGVDYFVRNKSVFRTM